MQLKNSILGGIISCLVFFSMALATCQVLQTTVAAQDRSRDGFPEFSLVSSLASKNRPRVSAPSVLPTCILFGLLYNM
jgi:hypothetical protein